MTLSVTTTTTMFVFQILFLFLSTHCAAQIQAHAARKLYARVDHTSHVIWVSWCKKTSQLVLPTGLELHLVLGYLQPQPLTHAGGGGSQSSWRNPMTTFSRKSHRLRHEVCCYWLVAYRLSNMLVCVWGGSARGNWTCCHTETEVADQTCCLTHSQYTDTGPTSPSADAITSDA